VVDLRRCLRQTATGACSLVATVRFSQIVAVNGRGGGGGILRLACDGRARCPLSFTVPVLRDGIWQVARAAKGSGL
jgi:hypothetical protein